MSEAQAIYLSSPPPAPVQDGEGTACPARDGKARWGRARETRRAGSSPRLSSTGAGLIEVERYNPATVREAVHLMRVNLVVYVVAHSAEPAESPSQPAGTSI